MAFVSGDYLGLSIDDYNTLMGFDAFADEWASQFTKLSAGNGEMYVFNGDEMEFLEYLEDAEAELQDGLTWFTYVRSTNLISGF